MKSWPQMSAFLVLSALIAAAPAQATTPKIAWYGTLKDGFAEAKRSNRPIMLLAAAPQCQNVSGMW